MKIFLSLLFFLSINSCFTETKSSKEIQKNISLNNQTSKEFKKAYFASGCFWCVESIYESVLGVEEVYSGYAGGETENPSYEKILTGKTGHAEAVEVIYNPKIISFENLVQIFFGTHDPTTLNRQGPDKGSQYRSIAFYQNENEKKIIESYIDYLIRNKSFKNKIVTEVKALKKFFRAEEYHQNFENKNPYNPYIINVSIPRLKKFQKKYSEFLKKDNKH
ncbi:MAG: peptide-methionine (S)-S-oxide reductase [Flavobacteriaceae bacterium]|nr:peptide-methionine (S)-S-oxide reductase [Flavobacteriaceae bacterium]